ncbi:MAG: xylosidase, partial [Candidatus Hydrogenedentes bacterium]|nr:xylosidase [Candidatus Hydrogenedentota bacterium]
TEISENRIYRTIRGIWLDWMNQGSRVTRNVLYENIGEDLFVEVNHGPFLVDHNLMLSETALLNMSEGGAYAHNLIAGRIVLRSESSRETPYHPAHSTEVAGLINIQGGDDRFYNNIFVGHDGLAGYDDVATPTFMAGNVFLMGAAPPKREVAPIVLPDFDPKLDLKSAGPSLNLQFIFDKAWGTANEHPLVTTELLGRAKIPGVPYELPDGAPIRLDTDYFGNPRDAENPYPGPFELPGGGEQALTIWPR